MYYEIKEIELLPGTSIKVAISYALNKAKKDNCIVTFNFSGLKVKVYPASNVEDLLKKYKVGLKSIEKEQNLIEETKGISNTKSHRRKFISFRELFNDPEELDSVGLDLENIVIEVGEARFELVDIERRKD